MPEPESVRLNRANPFELPISNTRTLWAKVYPKDASQEVTWESSNTDVATVSDGVVTPVALGTATITVTTINGMTDTVMVTVVPDPAKKVVLSKSGTVTLTLGKKLTVTATVRPATASQKVTWTSSAPKVASVNSRGVITAKSAGTTVITAKTANGKKSIVRIKVVQPAATKVILDQSRTVKLPLGETLKLHATVRPKQASQKVTWSTSNKKVAKVNSKGEVTPVKTGTVIITATTANGKTAKVKIRVVKAENALVLIGNDKFTAD